MLRTHRLSPGDLNKRILDAIRALRRRDAHGPPARLSRAVSQSPSEMFSPMQCMLPSRFLESSTERSVQGLEWLE